MSRKWSRFEVPDGNFSIPQKENSMKNALVVLLAVCLPITVWGQETRLPLKESQRYAELCVDHIGNPYGGQITTKVDPKKPCAELGEGGGAMVIPDAKLTKESIAKLGTDVIPVGQLWLRKWHYVVKGKTVSRNQVRKVTVLIDEKNRPMSLFLLGIRKGNTAPELVIFGQKNEPLQILPLKKLDLIQELPLEMEWQRGDNQIDSLRLHILGRFQTVLHVTRN